MVDQGQNEFFEFGMEYTVPIMFEKQLNHSFSTINSC